VTDRDASRAADTEPSLFVSAQARDALRAAARKSAGKERGGLLIGYRDGNDIVVEDIVEVPDATAGCTSYLRRERPARRALSAYLARTSAEDVTGYVGEWHTHPAPLPPSPTDQHTMRTMARKNRNPVALVVAAHDPDGGTVELHALVSKPDTARSRLTGRHTVCDVVLE
jgi:integrative and conjugative element protein (TIGR02256 family)